MIETLAVPLELLGVMEGHPTTFRASDGADVVLHSHLIVDPVPDAHRIIVVSVTDLRDAALGHRQTIKSGNETYLLRRPTNAEFRDMVTKSHDELKAQGGTPPPMPTDAEIERIVYGL